MRATLAGLGFVSLVALLPAHTAHGQSVEAPALTSEYLRDDRTLFFLGNYPAAFDVLSTLPEPSPDRLPVYAYEVACWLQRHPAVAVGVLPFTPPLRVRFYHVAAGQEGAPEPNGRPFFEATVWGCGQVL